MDAGERGAGVEKVFLLSPASCAGKRAQMLMRDAAAFELAVRVRSSPGAPLGEVFRFLSGLYFRGKMAYAETFASPPVHGPTTYVITAGRGLLPPETLIQLEDLRGFAGVPIAIEEPRYREPLERDLAQLAERLPASAQVILLGSVATDKYVQLLTAALGDRVFFPADFVGRGDMSRGGLMLRCVADHRELGYLPVIGASRRGTRPARLPKPARKPKVP